MPASPANHPPPAKSHQSTQRTPTPLSLTCTRHTRILRLKSELNNPSINSTDRHTHTHSHTHTHTHTLNHPHTPRTQHDQHTGTHPHRPNIDTHTQTTSELTGSKVTDVGRISDTFP